MSTIEIRSELALEVPAPVRIPVPAAALPRGEALFLRDAAGAQGAPPVPAQPDGDGAIVALVGPLTAGSRRRYRLEAGPAPKSAVALKPAGDHQLEVLVTGELFTRYAFGPDLPRPFFYPVLGAGGRPVTRGFPMENIPGETKDHKHHRSLWTAYGEVSGVDDWSEDRQHGRIVHQDFERQVGGPVFGEFVARNLWTAHDGKPLLRETRRVRVYNLAGDSRLFDYQVTFHASEGDVHFGDTKEGGIIAFRVATPMDANKGGRIENSNGGVGEKECWGKEAAWCDYSGPTHGAVLGIGVMDHPGNFRHPCHWHVRNYGLMGTNVFGTSSFEGGAPNRGAYTLKKGEELPFRYRVLIHPGDAARGKVADVYHGYAQPPTGQVIDPR